MFVSRILILRQRRKWLLGDPTGSPSTQSLVTDSEGPLCFPFVLESLRLLYSPRHSLSWLRQPLPPTPASKTDSGKLINCRDKNKYNVSLLLPGRKWSAVGCTLAVFSWPKCELLQPRDQVFYFLPWGLLGFYLLEQHFDECTTHNTGRK